MERVSVRRGNNPVIFVAPHGPDDNNTEFIAEMAAETCDGYYVINRGFERADVVDVDNDKANCNRIDHVQEDVVKDEFLVPIQKYVTQLEKKLHNINPRHYWHWPYWQPHNDMSKVRKPIIVHVHGCGNHVHNIAGQDVGVIIGYGLANKNNSITCEDWVRRMFVHEWRNLSMHGDVFEGQGGGNYAGRGRQNMNQYYRLEEHNVGVDSFQLEFPFSTRKDKSEAVLVGSLLGAIMSDIVTHDPANGYDRMPDQLFI